MAYIDNFMVKGNFAFDDIVKPNSKSDDVFTSLFELAKEYNDLYLAFKTDLESGMTRLELFKRHKKFIYLYLNYKNSLIFYNGKCNVDTRINDGDNSIFCHSEKFIIEYGNFYGDYISLVINLGEKFGINYKESRYYKKNKQTELEKNTWDNILSTTFINKKYTKKMI